MVWPFWRGWKSTGNETERVVDEKSGVFFVLYDECELFTVMHILATPN